MFPKPSNKKLSVLLSLFLLFLLPSVTLAHPSLWINNTIQSEIQQKANNNTKEWQEMKSWCDSHLGKNMPRAYNYFGWAHAVQNYGMCFVATGNQTYGNEGVLYLSALIRDRDTIGDGNGGSSSIQMDSGYVARTLGMALSIGRDWLDGAKNLSPQLIAEAVDVMDDWITWYNSNGYGRISPHTNYYAGYFGMVYLAGLSFSGDNNLATTWLEQASNMWTNDVLPLMNNGYLSGGDWLEGWNYGNLSARILLQYPHAVYTATGDSSKWTNTVYHHEFIKSQLNMLHPSRDSVSDDGSWSGDNKGYPHISTLMYLADSAPISNNEKGLISWYVQNITWKIDKLGPWEELLWRDSLTVPIVPTASNMGGLTYVTNGTGRLLTRENAWERTDGTFVEFQSYASNAAGHNERNQGEFKISSNGQQLIGDTDTYQTASSYGNVLLIEGTHTYAPNQEWWHMATNLNHIEDAGTYVYARATALDNAYDGKENDNPSASFYTREMLYIRPNYIFIVDSVSPTSQSTNTITSQIHTMGEPSISGNTFSVVNGEAKIFASIHGHSVNITKESTSSTRTDTWNIKLSPTTTSPNYKLIHVFETADSDKTQMESVTNIQSSKLQGVKIDKTIVLFNKEPTLAPVSGNIAYSHVGDATKHILTGLQPGASYNMEQNGDTVNLNSAGNDYVVTENGILSINTAGGSEGESQGNAPYIRLIQQN